MYFVLPWLIPHRFIKENVNEKRKRGAENEIKKGLKRDTKNNKNTKKKTKF